MNNAEVSCKNSISEGDFTMLIKKITLGACICSWALTYGAVPEEQNLPILEEALPVKLIQQQIAEYMFHKTNPLTQWLMQCYQQFRETPISTLSGPHAHTDAISSVAISPDGSKIVTGSDDKTAKIWNMADGSWIADLSGPHGHTDEINSVAISPDGSKVVTGSKDHTGQDLEYVRWLMDC